MLLTVSRHFSDLFPALGPGCGWLLSFGKERCEGLYVHPQRPSPDVKAELFELLFRTLHHNWRYFFKSTILASVQRGMAEEQMENQPQFSAIMQVTWRAGEAAWNPRTGRPHSGRQCVCWPTVPRFASPAHGPTSSNVAAAAGATEWCFEASWSWI